MVLDFPQFSGVDRQPEDAKDPVNALSGDGSNPTHHIVLTDPIGNSIGFVLTNQSGDMDERTFRRYPNSDPGNPYITEKQEGFAGFGQARFEDNRQLYWWSQGVDTSKGQLVLGPRFRYPTNEPWRDTAMYQPGDTDDTFEWVALNNDNAFLGVAFTPTASWTTAYIKLWVKRNGVQPGRLRVRIIADSAGNPAGSTLGTAYVAVADVDAENTGTWVRVAITASITNGNQTWVVVDAPDITLGSTGGRNEWLVGACGTRVSGKQSSNGSTWTVADNEFFYRLEETRNDFTPMFYSYKGQSYFMAKYENYGASRLFMNGWRGACDSNSGDKTNLNDSSGEGSAWGTEITGSEVARLVAGPGTRDEKDWRNVTAGASGVLTCSPDWSITHETIDDYVVLGSDYWQELLDGSSTFGAQVSDIAVCNGMVYMARSSLRDILIHREYNHDGTWKNGTNSADDAWKSKRVHADFLQVINDPISGPQLWIGQNPASSGGYQPLVAQAEPTTWENSALNFQTIIVHNGENRTVPWTAATSDVAVTKDAYGKVYIDVTIGKVYIGGVSISNGGTGYTNGSGKLFTLAQSGSSGTAVLSCTVSGGVVTSIDSVSTQGHSYVAGTVNGSTTGGGSGATFTLSGFEGFSTGQIAYANIVDADGSATTVDLRNMNLLYLKMTYNSSVKGTQTLNEGDLTFDLDGDLNAASPYANINVPGLTFDHKVGTRNEYISMDLDSYQDAASTASVGFTLANAKNRSFRLTLLDRSYALRDIKPIPVGNLDYDQITNLEAYGDPEALWVFTETGLGEIRNNLWMGLPQRELRNARHPSNGYGAEVSDVYLLFTWRGRVQQYFRQSLDDLGPDFPYELGDLGGDVVDILTYPGRTYVAIDGGDDKPSMVLMHKGGQWHEVYTSFNGEHIRKLHLQTIPDKPDRLWFGSGSDIMYVPIVLNAAELGSGTDYRFRGTGYLTTSWVYTARADLNKLFRSVVVTMQRANDSDFKVRMLYQIDDEDAVWRSATVSDILTASSEEFFIGAKDFAGKKSGNRIRVRLVLETADATKSPVVRAIQHRMFQMPETKFVYTFLSKASSLSINLRGDEERPLGTQATVGQGIQLLDNWAQSVMPLQVESNISVIDDKIVIMEALPSQLLMMVSDEKLEEQSLQITVNDV